VRILHAKQPHRPRNLWSRPSRTPREAMPHQPAALKVRCEQRKGLTSLERRRQPPNQRHGICDQLCAPGRNGGGDAEEGKCARLGVIDTRGEKQRLFSNLFALRRLNKWQKRAKYTRTQGNVANGGRCSDRQALRCLLAPCRHVGSAGATWIDWSGALLRRKMRHQSIQPVQPPTIWHSMQPLEDGAEMHFIAGHPVAMGGHRLGRDAGSMAHPATTEELTVRAVTDGDGRRARRRR
jgi:hypothetical protein